MQNTSSKLTLSSLANEFLKAFYIRLAIFLSISFKYFLENVKDSLSILKIMKEYSHNDSLKSGNSFEQKKKVKEIIKSKMAPLKSAATYSFYFFCFTNPIKYLFCFFFFFFFLLI
jgi:hypothetical protein